MIFDSVRDFVSRAIRVMRVSYHPTQEEFSMTAKITGLGIVLVGLVGYVIALGFSIRL